MAIKELKPEEFARSLAQQALEFVPQDFTDEHKNFVANKVLNFCILAADHLIQQYNDQFTDEEAAVVVQFIGEWTFHKTIDIIRANIPEEHWEQVLQQVAFSALKAALHAHSEKFDHKKAAAFIETHVMATYEETIKQLSKAGVIKKEEVQKVLSHSNVDQMAQEQGGNVAGSETEQKKTLKFAVIGMVLKKMPQEKAQSILNKFSNEDSQKIIQCMQIEGLEERLDKNLIQEYLVELRKNLSVISKPNANESIKSIKLLQEKFGEESIINFTMEERPKIQEFLSCCLFENPNNALKVELSPYIVKILHRYLRSKLTHAQKV